VSAPGSGDDFDFVLSYAVREAAVPPTAVTARIALSDLRGATVFLVASDSAHQSLALTSSGRILCRVRDFNLAAGTYAVTLFLADRGGDVLDCLNHVRTIDVVGGDYFGTGHPGFPEQCKTLTRSEWSVD
jgi:lipopolysaccharide transport system ATP-binding protein